jgi:hypothetical protein
MRLEQGEMRPGRCEICGAAVALRGVGRGIVAQVDVEPVPVYPDASGIFLGWSAGGEKVVGEIWRDGPPEMTTRVQRHHRITCVPRVEDEGWDW